MVGADNDYFVVMRYEGWLWLNYDSIPKYNGKISLDF